MTARRKRKSKAAAPQSTNPTPPRVSKEVAPSLLRRIEYIARTAELAGHPAAAQARPAHRSLAKAKRISGDQERAVDKYADDYELVAGGKSGEGDGGAGLPFSWATVAARDAIRRIDERLTFQQRQVLVATCVMCMRLDVVASTVLGMTPAPIPGQVLLMDPVSAAEAMERAKLAWQRKAERAVHKVLIPTILLVEKKPLDSLSECDVNASLSPKLGVSRKIEA